MSEEPTVYQPARFRRVYVDSDARLREVLPELEAAPSIGVDVEMGQRIARKPGGLQEWIHILALIQIATDHLSVVIDPLRCRDLSPLRPLMSGPTIKVFLGGGQDVPLLEKSGVPVRNVIDVGELALGLFGRREDGMAALAHRIFGISLDKTVRRTDWLARPLNAALIAYAHRDAELTLLIYRWLKERYPEATALHQRVFFEPPVSRTTPRWLQDAIRRPTYEVKAIAEEHGYGPEHSERFVRDVRLALEKASAPRQINRLLRIAGELGLSELLPQVVPLAQSHTALLRASAARAIGQLADPEEGRELLAELQRDPVEDVRKAATLALRDLRSPAAGEVEDEEPEVEPSLNGDALAALQQLRERLEAE